MGEGVYNTRLIILFRSMYFDINIIRITIRKIITTE